MLQWKDDEPLGLDATISPVLYANTVHPELKQQYPDWSERCKQIGILWRIMNTVQRNPYLGCLYIALTFFLSTCSTLKFVFCELDMSICNVMYC